LAIASSSIAFFAFAAAAALSFFGARQSRA